MKRKNESQDDSRDEFEYQLQHEIEDNIEKEEEDMLNQRVIYNSAILLNSLFDDSFHPTQRPSGIDYSKRDFSERIRRIKGDGWASQVLVDQLQLIIQLYEEIEGNQHLIASTVEPIDEYYRGEQQMIRMRFELAEFNKTFTMINEQIKESTEIIRNLYIN